MTRLERLRALPGKPISVWRDTTPKTHFPRLEDDLEVDVAVVGGGIAGLSTALLLAEAGQKVAVMEMGRIVEGVTGNTTAKLTVAHGLIYHYLEATFSPEGARCYAEANQAGIELVADLSTRYGIDCDFQRTLAYTYTTQKSKRPQIEQEVKASQEAGLAASFIDSVPLPFSVDSAVQYENQAEFHPRKYLLGLAKEIIKAGSQIFEQSRAIDIEEGEPCRVITERGKVRARKVVIASHFPFYDKAGYFSRLAPYRSYAIGLYLNDPPPKGMFYTEEEEGFDSLRTQATSEGTLVIVGGEGHKAGQGGDTIARYERLEQAAREKLDVRSVAYRWSAQDVTTPDRVPYIGLHTPASKHVYLATGFGGWGMSTGGLAAILIKDQILATENRWSDLFNPNRFKVAGISTLAKENINVAKELVTGKVKQPEKLSLKDLVAGEGRVAEVDGKVQALYKDESGQVIQLSPACTHMGCTLVWNPAEGSWDCPCHGSRFTAEGKVIQGPAVRDLEPGK